MIHNDPKECLPDTLQIQYVSSGMEYMNVMLDSISAWYV